MRIAINIILCFITLTSFSQTYNNVTSQYIQNASFEEYTACPESNSVYPQGMWIDSVVGWYSPTAATSDYMNSCNIADNGVPNNFNAAYQQAFDGEAYCGFLAYSIWDNKMWSEYIGTELISVLEKDKYYRFSMQINRANDYNFSVSRIGANFSSTCLCKNNSSPFNIEPTIINNAGFLNDTTNWMTIEGSFKANGDEKFLTIGWFGDTITSDYTFFIPPVIEDGDSLYLTETYYLVDYLKLEEVQFEFDSFNYNVLTPNNDQINDFINFKNYPFETINFYVYNRWGNLVYFTNDNNISWSGTNNENETLTDGTYFYILKATTFDGLKINEQHSITIINI